MKKILLLLLFLYAYRADGQSTLRLQHITVDDGLSQSSINNIFQDRQGFIWFATGDGLDRYDGKEFIVYKSHFGDTLPSQMKDRDVNSNIFEDKDNKIWLATDWGLSFVNTKNTGYKVVLSGYAVQNDAILLGVEGDTLWSAVNEDGFYAVNTSTLRSSHYSFGDPRLLRTDKVCIVHGGVLTGEGIYIADMAGLFFRDRKTGEQKRLLENSNFTSVHRLADGRFLLTAAGGIYLYDVNKGSLEFVPITTGGEKTVQWQCAAQDRSGAAYLGARNSGTICRFDPATHRYQFLDLQDDPVVRLFIDASQNLWIGTDGNGVFKLDIKPPNFYCYIPPIPGNKNESFMVKSIYRDSSGIWMGTFNHGLVLYDPRTEHQRQIPLPFPTDALSVTAVFKDSAGRMVVACRNEIVWISPKTLRPLLQVSLPRVLSASPDLPLITSVVEWKKDRFLAGSNAGLYAISVNRQGSVATAAVSQTTPRYNFYTYDLATENDGTVDVGKRNGYAHIQMVNETSIKVLFEGFDQVAIRHFYRSTSTSVLWMASEKGLIAWNDKSNRYKVFDETAGLANSYVYAILPQNDSVFWVSTNKGLSRLSVHYGNGTDIAVQFTNYSEKDGLQSNEFNTGAYYRDHDGTFYFGGIAGVNWFRPENVKPNPYLAKPAIVDIYINDTLFARDSACWIRSLSLPYSGNTIGITFRALEYTRAGQNIFAYKLDGLDKDWVTTANDKVRYSNLPPGTYNFLLKVSNNDRVWNEQPLQLQITVLPPYWQTWWFRLVAVTVLAAVAFAAARSYISRKVRARTRELEKQQALYLERLRISKDVHDDLGSGLSKISLMADMAQKRTNGDARLGNDIRHISAVSKELVDNMRDLIWVLNPENTTLEQLISRLREYCSDYLENMPVAISLDFPDVVPAMRIAQEAQRNIFLTAKEAINNCIKHAQATVVKISVCLHDEKMTVTVTDNGKGFDVTDPKGSGNGLRNMKQRIEQIGGTLEICSEARSTSVRMTVPLEALKVKIPL